MEIIQPKTLLYDPNIYAYDTTNFWKTTLGTPTSTGTPATLLFNADAAASLATGVYGRYTFSLNIPAVPTAADVRSWGLKSTGLGNKGAMYFDVTDTAFTFKIYDAQGTAIESLTIPWLAAWTAAQTNFIIDWRAENVSISIGLPAAVPTTYGKWTGIQDIPALPLNAFISNTNADNLYMSYLLIEDASQWNKSY